MSPYGVPGLRNIRRTIKRHGNLSLTYSVEVLLVFDRIPTVRVGRRQTSTARDFWSERMELRLNKLVGSHRHDYSGRNVRLTQAVSFQDMVHETKTPARLADATMEVLGSSYKTPPVNVKRELSRLARHTRDRYEVHLRHVQLLMMLLSTRPEPLAGEADLAEFTSGDPRAWMKGLTWQDRSILWHENTARGAIEVRRCSSGMTRRHVRYAIQQHMSVVTLGMGL